MNTTEPTILTCTIGPYPRPMPQGMMDQMPSVNVQMSNGESVKLFEFYPDEISFTESEFIGLTLDEARRLKYVKDLEFIKSE